MSKFLFRIARIKSLGTLIGLTFAHFPFLIPIKKIMQNKKVVSFAHPAATYPEHVLIIPRKIVRTVFHLSLEDFDAIFEMAAKIRHGDNRDFVLLINGGKRQDVMQAHFHLFTGNFAAEKGLTKETYSPFLFSDLQDILVEQYVYGDPFSLVFQFENGAVTMMHFV